MPCATHAKANEEGGAMGSTRTLRIPSGGHEVVPRVMEKCEHRSSCEEFRDKAAAWLREHR